MPWDALYQSAVLVLLLDFQNFYCCLHNTRLDSDQKKNQSGKSCINNTHPAEMLSTAIQFSQT